MRTPQHPGCLHPPDITVDSQPGTPPSHRTLQVGQALSLSQPGPSAWSQASLLTAELSRGLSDTAVRGGSAAALAAAAGGGAGAQPGRVVVVPRDEPLRGVLERLAAPGARRLVVVQRGSGRVEGLVSLSDVCKALFL